MFARASRMLPRLRPALARASGCSVRVPLRLAGAAFAPLTSARMPQAAAAVAAAGATLLAGHAQVNAAGDTLYDKVAALAAAVDALEQKAGGAGDLK